MIFIINDASYYCRSLESYWFGFIFEQSNEFNRMCKYKNAIDTIFLQTLFWPNIQSNGWNNIYVLSAQFKKRVKVVLKTYKHRWTNVHKHTKIVKFRVNHDPSIYVKKILCTHFWSYESNTIYGMLILGLNYIIAVT